MAPEPVPAGGGTSGGCTGGMQIRVGDGVGRGRLSHDHGTSPRYRSPDPKARACRTNQGELRGAQPWGPAELGPLIYSERLQGAVRLPHPRGASSPGARSCGVERRGHPPGAGRGPGAPLPPPGTFPGPWPGIWGTSLRRVRLTSSSSSSTNTLAPSRPTCLVQAATPPKPPPTAAAAAAAAAAAVPAAAIRAAVQPATAA